jgi:hypothetical protein
MGAGGRAAALLLPPQLEVVALQRRSGLPNREAVLLRLFSIQSESEGECRHCSGVVADRLNCRESEGLQVTLTVVQSSTTTFFNKKNYPREVKKFHMQLEWQILKERKLSLCNQSCC